MRLRRWGAFSGPQGPEALEPYRDMIGAAAGRFGLDPRLIMAVTLVESGQSPGHQTGRR